MANIIINTNDNKRWEVLRNYLFVKVQIVFFLIVGLLLVCIALWCVETCTGPITCFDCPDSYDERRCEYIIDTNILLFGILCIWWSWVIMKIMISDLKNKSSYILYKVVLIISVLAMILMVGWVVMMIVLSLISPRILG